MLGSGIGFLIATYNPYNLVIGFGFLVANVIIGYGGQKILQHHLKVPNLWFLMTIIVAIPEAILFGFIKSHISDSDYSETALFQVAFGLIVAALFCVFISGILQWLVLRRIVSRAGHWIWISVLCSICYVVCLSLCFYLPETIFPSSPSIPIPYVNSDVKLLTIFVVGVIPGAVSGAISGVLLLWLLREPAFVSGREAICS